ncbi:MAG: sugar ABC transporter permease [Actinobacteria bacterium]|nr:sugar ABC transporter permease [Actinomycetota bacterium]
MSVTKSGQGRRKAPLSPWKNKKPKEAKVLPGVASLDGRWAFLFVAPFFFMFLVFGLAPVIYSVYISFFQWDPLGGSTFAGLHNFYNLIHDSDLWLAIRNTFSIWALSTFPQMFMAIGFAAILRNKRLKGKSFWRTILLVPNITSVIAITIVFQQLFGRDFGMINYVLTLFGLGHHIDFIEGVIPSHIAIATMITWRWIGYNTLIFLASMLAIPDELYESASVDGASKWKQFVYVTLPGLRNTITFVIVVGTIGGLQVFAEPQQFAPDGGSSKQFLTLTLFLYNQAFVNNKYGYAAAIGIIITFIVMIISAVNFLITRKISDAGSR